MNRKLFTDQIQLPDLLTHLNKQMTESDKKEFEKSEAIACLRDLDKHNRLMFVESDGGIYII